MDSDTSSAELTSRRNIPPELVEEILSVCPVKSLLRFRSVSKSWCSLIDSKRFMKAHLQYSTKGSVIIDYHCPIKQFSLHSLLNDPYRDESTIDDPVITELISIRIVGCCNGLICLLDESESFFLWNPSTRTSNKLPRMGKNVVSTGFGWDESSDDYKVFAKVIEYSSKRVGINIYSLKRNSWKIVEDEGFYASQCYEEGKFAGGKLHWHNNYYDGIVTLDLKNEAFGKVREPMAEVGFCLELGVMGQRLCMVCNGANVLDVWVMKECWEKLVSFPHPINIEHRALFLTYPFGEGPNGEIVLIYGSIFIVYSPTKANVDVVKVTSFRSAHFYIQTLVSPLPILN